MSVIVRTATQEDLDALERIENAADSLLIERLKPGEWPPGATGMQRATAPGFILVSSQGADGPAAGFVHVLLIDDLAHLEQLSVLPDYGRQGHGRMLVEAAKREARERDCGRMTLRTFADIPWNAPFYATCGFVESEPVTDFHRELVKAETRLGLEKLGRRVEMTANLSAQQKDGQMEPTTRIQLDLETERLRLRAWTDSDTAWHRYLVGERGGDLPSAKADAEVIASVVSAQNTHGVVPSVVVRKVDGEVLGYCGLVIGRATIEEPELAYELFRHAHGNGYATEAASAVVAAAAQTGRSRLWSTVRAWNAPSLRVLEKLGFVRDHSTRDDKGEITWNLLELA